MGQSVELLMVTSGLGLNAELGLGMGLRLLEGVSRSGGGRKGLSWPPPPWQPPWERTGARMAADGAGDTCSGKGLLTGTPPSSGIVSLRSRTGGPGQVAPGPGWDGRAQLGPSCSRKGLKEVTGIQWFSYSFLQRSKILQWHLHQYKDSHGLEYRVLQS